MNEKPPDPAELHQYTHTQSAKPLDQPLSSGSSSSSDRDLLAEIIGGLLARHWLRSRRRSRHVPGPEKVRKRT